MPGIPNDDFDGMTSPGSVETPPNDGVPLRPPRNFEIPALRTSLAEELRIMLLRHRGATLENGRGRVELQHFFEQPPAFAHR